MAGPQPAIDADNASFWDEACGTVWAQTHGVPTAREDLAAFDRAFLDNYPYLDRYLPGAGARGKRVLEIGLGSGTVSQILVERGLDFHGLDIAEGPVEIVRMRLHRLGYRDVTERVRRGSALEIPHEDASFDFVVTIGTLHVTGNLPLAVREVRRVLRPGGIAFVMIYNRASYRQLVDLPWQRAKARRAGEVVDRGEQERTRSDPNSRGEGAPHVDFTWPWAIKRRLFKDFSRVRLTIENFDTIILPSWGGKGRWIDRKRLLGNVARVAGLDLYITATR